jgi:hypothetical protein
MAAFCAASLALGVLMLVCQMIADDAPPPKLAINLAWREWAAGLPRLSIDPRWLWFGRLALPLPMVNDAWMTPESVEPPRVARAALPAPTSSEPSDPWNLDFADRTGALEPSAATERALRADAARLAKVTMSRRYAHVGAHRMSAMAIVVPARDVFHRMKIENSDIRRPGITRTERKGHAIA